MNCNLWLAKGFAPQISILKALSLKHAQWPKINVSDCYEDLVQKADSRYWARPLYPFQEEALIWIICGNKPLSLFRQESVLTFLDALTQIHSSFR